MASRTAQRTGRVKALVDTVTDIMVLWKFIKKRIRVHCAPGRMSYRMLADDRRLRTNMEAFIRRFKGLLALQGQTCPENPPIFRVVIGCTYEVCRWIRRMCVQLDPVRDGVDHGQYLARILQHGLPYPDDIISFLKGVA